MDCAACQTPAKKFGKTPDGHQRYRCRTCRKTFSERPDRPLGDMRLPVDRALLCLNLLCEGNAVRSIERITGTDKKTILRLLVQVGEGCERMLAETVKAVPVQDVQADELWTYIRCKQATRERNKISDPDAGDAYCYFGIERNSKLILAWHLGRRNGWDAHDFMEKLSGATAGQFQLSTDGFNAYPNAVEYNLGARVDYAQVVKEFASAGGEEARRYGPPRLIGQEKVKVSGNPDEDKISTSHVERANWTLRGHLRRFTRLSNGFSRKKENLRAALALYFAYYKFVRFHKSVRMTPAMAAGIARKPWSLADLLAAAQGAAA
jgi:transposase-like protein/IS1 family transposase